MEQAGPSGLLHVAEAVHWTALTIMVLVYTIRLFWLFRFKAGRDRQRPGERYGDTSLYPALDSMANVGMPWVMESTRKNIPFYLSFVVFHIGVAAGIFFAIVGSAYRPFVEIPVVTYVLMVLIGAAFVVAVGRGSHINYQADRSREFGNIPKIYGLMISGLSPSVNSNG